MHNNDTWSFMNSQRPSVAMISIQSRLGSSSLSKHSGTEETPTLWATWSHRDRLIASPDDSNDNDGDDDNDGDHMPLDRTEIDTWPALIAGGYHILIDIYICMYVRIYVYMLRLFTWILKYMHLYGYVWDINLFLDVCIYDCT
jgi:hypothetical protein